jgi:hypothetical protein
MSPEEKRELAQLLDFKTMTPHEQRRARMRAAEERLGFWRDGVFTGFSPVTARGIAEIITASRQGRPITVDEAMACISFGEAPAKTKPLDIPIEDLPRYLREAEAS